MVELPASLLLQESFNLANWYWKQVICVIEEQDTMVKPKEDYESWLKLLFETTVTTTDNGLLESMSKQTKATCDGSNPLAKFNGVQVGVDTYLALQRNSAIAKDSSK